MLVDSPRLTDEDRAAWAVLARRFRRPAWQVDRWTRHAQGAIRRFLASGPAHVGVSWGKDSVTVAHLTRGVSPDVPCCWVRLPGADNPECPAVRDAYLDRWPSNYVEIDAPPPTYRDGWLVTGARRVGYAAADRELGARRILGIRAAESSTRELSAAVHGVATERVCRPILHWPTAEVFAYLLRHDLPIHPAYAMSDGGRLDIERLRVASIGGRRGAGAGRREWERRYYGDCQPYSVVAPGGTA